MSAESLLEGSSIRIFLFGLTSAKQEKNRILDALKALFVSIWRYWQALYSAPESNVRIYDQTILVYAILVAYKKGHLPSQFLAKKFESNKEYLRK